MNRTIYSFVLITLFSQVSAARLDAQQESARASADIIVDCKIASVYRFLDAHDVRIGNLFSIQPTSQTGPLSVRGLAKVEKFFVGGRMGVFQGAANVLHSQVFFENPKALSDAVDFKKQPLDASGRLILSDLVGFGPVVLSQKSPQTIVVESQAESQNDLKSFYQGIQSKAWKDNEKAVLRVAIDLESLRTFAISIAQNNLSDINLSRALTETIEICDRLHLFCGSDQYAIRICLEPSADSNARPLKQRVGGLVYLVHSGAKDFFESSGTGDESLDDSILAAIEDVEPELSNEYVMVTLVHSEGIDGIVRWAGKLINQARVVSEDTQSP